jgi:hypothetical protein
VTPTDLPLDDGSGQPTVLVPLQVLEGEALPEGVPSLLAHAHVVLLGYHVVPEQTATGQARMQFEERAARRLDEFEEILTSAGATVERRLVFTHEAQRTLNRLIYEYGCNAVLVPSATGHVEDVLVAVRGDVGLDRIAHVVAGLFAETDASVTLYHHVSADETDADAESLVGGLRERLTERGVDPDAVVTRLERDGDPLEAITAAADEFDVVVLGESDPSLVTFVFGMVADQVAERFLGPVLVVQRERPADARDAEPDADAGAASEPSSDE